MSEDDASPVVVSDVGGTNVRFAAYDQYGVQLDMVRYPVAAHKTFADAFHAFAGGALQGRKPVAIAVGAAGPVRNGHVSMTNVDWVIREHELAALTSAGIGVLVNDLPPIARAIPELAIDEKRALIGQPLPNEHIKTALAVNVGTGFGAAALHRMPSSGCEPQGERWFVAATEAGHMLNPMTGSDDTFEERLAGPFVSAQSASHGLGDPGGLFTPGAPQSAFDDAVDFTRQFGGAIANLVLAHAAWDGVYLVGSVAVAWANAVVREQGAGPMTDALRSAVHQPGKMQTQLEGVPVVVVDRVDPGLLGLRKLLEDRVNS